MLLAVARSSGKTDFEGRMEVRMAGSDHVLRGFECGDDQNRSVRCTRKHSQLVAYWPLVMSSATNLHVSTQLCLSLICFFPPLLFVSPVYCGSCKVAHRNSTCQANAAEVLPKEKCLLFRLQRQMIGSSWESSCPVGPLNHAHDSLNSCQL